MRTVGTASSITHRFLSGAKAPALRRSGMRVLIAADGERFALRERCGEGGFSEIWQAHRGAQRYAVKLYNPQTENSSQIEHILAAELRAGRRIRHRNVIEYHGGGWGMLGPCRVPYVQLELFEASTLSRLSGIDTATFVTILRQVLEGVEAIHGADILHADLKPNNILVDAEQRAKVIDFGASTSIVHPDFIIVPDDFTAPEVASRTLVAVGRWSDLYSVGATFSTWRLALELSLPPVIFDGLKAMTEAEPQDRPASADAALRRMHLRA